MADTVIWIENLGKTYRLRHQARRQRYVALRDVLANQAKAAGRRLWAVVRPRSARNPTGDVAGSVEEFWALRDVSFQVTQGQVVGIIGRNGAGKSTLLKILSQITEPTTGRVRMRGRTASLLEVGTGFHPELTGRENIFINGAILGMKRAEIRARFDEIVAFAEVEKFLDTPVKRYSSGMYVRLAFTVAAHLEPEILVIDEVLAVGDAKFQQRCLGKMDEISRSGRTVLFVSHNMGTVGKLCSHVILLSGGRLDRQGQPAEIIAAYLNQAAPSQAGGRVWNIRSPEHPFVLRAVEVLDAAGKPACLLPNSEPFSVRVSYELTAPMIQLRVGFRLHAQDGTVVLSTTDCDALGGRLPARAPGLYASDVRFPPQLLNRGRYYLWIGIDVPLVSSVLSLDQAASFSIEAVGGLLADLNDGRLGVVAPLLPWTVQRLVK